MSERKPSAVERREQGGVAVARIGRGRYRTEVSMPGKHALVADEPGYAGGTDTGAAPIDLMAASLASCKAVTLRMQADRHGWPLEGATVEVVHRRVSARSLGEASRGCVDLMECEIELEGDALTVQQRQRLLKLSANCWVQHALERPVRVASRLAGEA